jgi:hypothetical protein
MVRRHSGFCWSVTRRILFPGGFHGKYNTGPFFFQQEALLQPFAHDIGRGRIMMARWVGFTEYRRVGLWFRGLQRSDSMAVVLLRPISRILSWSLCQKFPDLHALVIEVWLLVSVASITLL